MPITTVTTIGILCGLHAATWGAYKDAPFEGFRWASYLRSPILAGVIGLVLTTTTNLAAECPPIVVAGVIYAGERLTTEWWKAILRRDDQNTYTIPMRLGCRGRPIDKILPRYAVGGMVLLFLSAGLFMLHIVAPTLQKAPDWSVIMVGTTGACATAFGGAWKDAPIEGFSTWKFLRSPLVGACWAIPLSTLTTSITALILSTAGLAVATIETYKAFLTHDRPPGKFATKTRLPSSPGTRGLHAVGFAAIWGIFTAAAIASIATGSHVAHQTLALTALATTGMTAAAASLQQVAPRLAATQDGHYRHR